MKAIDEYFLMVMFVLLLNTVHVFANFMFIWREQHGSEKVKFGWYAAGSTLFPANIILSPSLLKKVYYTEVFKTCFTLLSLVFFLCHKLVSQTCAVAKTENPGGSLDNQTWQTNIWLQLPGFGFRVQTTTLGSMEQSSILSAKFDCPVPWCMKGIWSVVLLCMHLVSEV